MYSLITSAMTWSYSRISCFQACPYQFFLSYIDPCPSVPLFFSDYGKFIHALLASFYNGQKTKEEVIVDYLLGFSHQVAGRAPDSSIFARYFHQGLSHLKGLVKPNEHILGVESNVSFRVGNYPFTGFIDLILRDDNDDIILVDHKSRALKARSTKGRQTKTDEELDNYLRQLYLYSIPVEQTYGRFPSFLVFNCYRSGTVIREPFSASALQSAKDWANRSVDTIVYTEDFCPDMDYYFCRHICDVHHSCEYYAMQS